MISVIIPAYNAGQYIKECLESVINQTYSDIEIICLNDGSDDNTLDIIQSFAEKDRRIKVINNNKNIGVSNQRNIGISKASGKYLYFMDADDWIDNSYLEGMFENAEKTKADMVINANIIKEYPESRKHLGRKYERLPLEGKTYGREELLDLTQHNFSAIWSCLYNKAVFDELGLKFIDCNLHDDLHFQHLYMNNVSNIKVYYGSAYHWRQHSLSLMHTTTNVVMRKIEIYEHIIQLYREHNWLNRNIHFINFQYVVEGLTAESFQQLKEFIIMNYQLIKENSCIFNECDNFIINAVLENDSYEELEVKYTSDIVKYYYFERLRKNIREDYYHG